MRAIDADAMIDRLKEWDTKDKTDKALYNFTLNRIIEQPTIQPEPHYGEWCGSCKEYDQQKHCCPRWNKVIKNTVEELKSAQPERRCVNCGRTVNNGGWYEDGRTRCPIEEHYALPKDGYCHLWEKRKDWEDAYVKRAEEGEK